MPYTVKLVSNKIPSIPAELKDAAVAEVKRTAFDIQAEAQRIVPVRTGTLRRSIHTVTSEEGLHAEVGPSVEYGLYVEFGARGRSARPYMRPAAAKVLPAFLERMRELCQGLG